MANKVLTEKEVADTGGKTTSNPTLCCTAARAGALNCNVTSPSGAASNQLITGVSRKIVTGCYVNISWTNVSGSQTSPAINFYNSSGTSLGGVSRQNAPCEIEMKWSATGTVTKIGLSVNYAKYLTVTGKNGNTLLYKTSVSNYCTVTLNSSFSTSDYNNGSATIYLSFTDNY